MKDRMVPGLLSIAREDLAAAERLLQDFPRGAGFHLQQAAEKSLKAVLAAEDVDYPFIHRIATLAAFLPPSHIWRDPFERLDVLTEFATVQRYMLPDGDRPDLPPGIDLGALYAFVSRLMDQIEPWSLDRLAQRS